MAHLFLFSTLVGNTFSVMYSTDASFPINFTLRKLRCFLKFLNQSLLIKLVASTAVLVPSAPVVTWKLFFFYRLLASSYTIFACRITCLLCTCSYQTLTMFLTFINYSLLSYEQLCTGWNILWKNFYVFLNRVCRVLWVTTIFIKTFYILVKKVSSHIFIFISYKKRYLAFLGDSQKYILLIIFYLNPGY